MKKNKITLLFGGFLIASFVQAQEFSFYVNSGLQGLDYKVEEGENKLKIGGKVGVGYTYFITSHFGIVTGLEVSIFKNESTLKDQSYSTFQLDEDNEEFEYRIKTKGYMEKRKFSTLSIPLMLQYRTIGKTQFYINAGGRVTFPMKQKVDVTVKEVTFSGYYANFNVELVDMPEHGFGTISNWKGQNEVELKTGFSLSSETGISFKLSEKLRMYTGVYLDYGLNDMVKTVKTVTDNSLITYDPQGLDNHPSGILGTTNLKNEAKLLAYGIQVRLGLGSRKEKQQQPLVEENQPIEELITEEHKSEIIRTEVEKVEVVEKISLKEKELIEQSIEFNELRKTDLTIAS